MTSALTDGISGSGIQFFETVLNGIGTYIIAIDPETHLIIYANTVFKKDFGKSCEGRKFWQFVPGYALLKDKGASVYKGEKIEALESNNSRWEYYVPDKDCWLSVFCSQTEWTGGKHAILLNCQDITSSKRYEEKIEKLAFIDSLTSLPNRTKCEADMKTFLSSPAFNRNGYFMLIDMDDFKKINDGLGHIYGDTMLCELGAYFRKIVPRPEYVYRFGGDEFAIILPSPSTSTLEVVSKLLFERSKSVWKILDREFYCTLSIGVVEFDFTSKDLYKTLKNADLALAKAKEDGKNNITVYNEDFINNSSNIVKTERALRDAINNNFDGFKIFYHSFIDNNTGSLYGVEALIRWIDAKGGMHMPMTFIPLAEQLGLIEQIGEFVLREACIQCKNWNDNGSPDLVVSVNVSIRQLQQENFAQLLEDILRTTGVNPANVVLEITEGLAIRDLKYMVRLLKEVKSLGVRIAMDDFGTGYSSLNNLRELPIDIIKIDRSFIKDIENSDYSDKFIKLISDLGHSLNKSVCAEGVETKELQAFCLSAKVDLSQGYLFGKPQPAEEITEMLKNLSRVG